MVWNILLANLGLPSRQSPASLLPPLAYLLWGAEGRGKTLTPRVGIKTSWDIPEHAGNLTELVHDLTEGCLACPSETQQLLALFWGLASAC